MTEKTIHKVSCDMCSKNKAKYDSKSVYGTWAYMCEPCAKLYSIGKKTDLDKVYK
jgi:hypothetical protein